MENTKQMVGGVLALIVLGCGGGPVETPESATACVDATGITGVYKCVGECVITENGIRKVIAVDGETDTISVFPGASAGLFRVEITGAGGFHEVEIGALAGTVLRTATAAVSDGQFPVLEEYVFELDGRCEASGYTKLVRNPSIDAFKACRIRCQR